MRKVSVFISSWVEKNFHQRLVGSGEEVVCTLIWKNVKEVLFRQPAASRVRREFLWRVGAGLQLFEYVDNRRRFSFGPSAEEPSERGAQSPEPTGKEPENFVKSSRVGREDGGQTEDPHGERETQQEHHSAGERGQVIGEFDNSDSCASKTVRWTKPAGTHSRNWSRCCLYWVRWAGTSETSPAESTVARPAPRRKCLLKFSKWFCSLSVTGRSEVTSNHQYR